MLWKSYGKARQSYERLWEKQWMSDEEAMKKRWNRNESYEKLWKSNEKAMTKL